MQRTYIAYKMPTIGTMRPYLNPHTGEYFKLDDLLARMAEQTDDKPYIIAAHTDNPLQCLFIGVVTNGDLLRPGMVPANELSGG